MKKFLKKLVSRPAVSVLLVFFTLYDMAFTLLIMRRVPDADGREAAEGNVLLRHFFVNYGIEYTLLLIFPLTMLFVILMINRFWETPRLRWVLRPYAYYLCLIRVYLFIQNFGVAYALFKES